MSVMNEENIVCKDQHSHATLLDMVSKILPNDENLDSLSNLYKVFGDKTRIKILCALLGSEMSVSTLSKLVEMSVSAVSHQLRILKQAKLVKYRREGKSIIYSLADDHVKTILHNGIDHVTE